MGKIWFAGRPELLFLATEFTDKHGRDNHFRAPVLRPNNTACFPWQKTIKRDRGVFNAEQILFSVDLDLFNVQLACSTLNTARSTLIWICSALIWMS